MVELLVGFTDGLGVCRGLELLLDVDLLAHFSDDEDVVDQRFAVGCVHDGVTSVLGAMRSFELPDIHPRRPPTRLPSELSAALPR